MNKRELMEALAANGLSGYFEKLESLIKSTIMLYPQVTKGNLEKLGTSKIGGCPDLPINFQWPTENTTKSLSFIAQINLAEISQVASDSELPKTGILYFFYAAAQNAWGFDYSDNDKFKVLFYDGDLNGLVTTSFPKDLPQDARYKETSIEAKCEVSLPTAYNLYDELAKDDCDKLYDVVHGFESANKMLGYPDVIQNEMELECELVTNGLYCGDPSGYNDPRAKQFENTAKDWQLLLQIDSNEENEMMWGDCGRLYFWIKKVDLATRSFDKAWFIFQCY